MPAGRGVVRIKGLDWPLTALQKVAVSVLPIGLRATSPNGRELRSRYFILRGPKMVPAGEALERYWAEIWVLGDQRPYTVEIQVLSEMRRTRGDGFEYVPNGYDEMQAEDLATRLRDQLTKRREDRNIIDDFRVF